MYNGVYRQELTAGRRANRSTKLDAVSVNTQHDKVHRCRYCSAVSESVISDVRLIRTHAHDTGDIGHVTVRDFCQTEELVTSFPARVIR